jgi:ABC-2 type transport system permease protein
MNWKKTWVIVRREYLERVRTKAFWIATLLIPVFFLALFMVQIAAMKRSSGERKLAIVDLTGRFAAPLAKELADQERSRAGTQRSQGVHWIIQELPVTGTLESTKTALQKEVLAKKLNGYLILDPVKLQNAEVEYYSSTVSEIAAMNQLESALTRVRLRQKISERGLPASLGTELEKGVDLKAFKVTEKGTAEERGAGLIVAIVLFFLMYGTFFMYGYQVMRGVIEEKSNRIVEIIIASVRPTELMLGKILGIGLVGLTQYFVWSLVAANLSILGIAGAMASGVGVPQVPLSMLGFFMLFFLLGYFLYASVYTAIAAPFNTDQEAQQLAAIPMILIISGIAVYPAVMNNPSGPVALFFSLFPFTSSLTMFFRTALSDPPAWQILVSVGLSVATTTALTWFAGRIYRVGILMYGKKPTIPEILRWVRYRPGKMTQPAVERAS